MSTEAGPNKPVQLALKRLFDVASSAAILVVFSPVFALTALLVKLSSPGPVLFIQERVGRDEKPFRIYKFRTMAVRPESEQGLRWSAADAAAVTRIGNFLRDYGLDELPQVVNILKGDMSVVGPRPPMAAQLATFTDEERRMFRMRPGVLSLDAIKGRRSLPMKERLRLRVEYVENWSLALDWRILWKSAFVVLRREAAQEQVVG